jgi:hypothetical protein
MLLLYYDNNVIEDFLKTLDGISGSSYKDQKYCAYIKEKFEFRKKRMLEIKYNTENEQELYRFLSSKTWRSFTLAEIRNLPIKYKLDNFMLAEICWGWLHSNRQASKSNVYKIWNMIYASFDDTKSLCFYKKILKDQFARDFDVKDLNYSEHDNHNRSLEKNSTKYKETQPLPYVGINAIDTEKLLNNDTKNGMLATVNDFPSFSMPCYEHPLSSMLPYKIVKNIDSDCYHGISQIVRDMIKMSLYKSCLPSVNRKIVVVYSYAYCPENLALSSQSLTWKLVSEIYLQELCLNGRNPWMNTKRRRRLKVTKAMMKMTMKMIVMKKMKMTIMMKMKMVITIARLMEYKTS